MIAFRVPGKRTVTQHGYLGLAGKPVVVTDHAHQKVVAEKLVTSWSATQETTVQEKL